MSLFHATLYGNLTRDPETRNTPQGTQLCQFSVAHNFRRGQEEAVMFVDVTVWGKQAEIAQKYLQKGKPVLLTGRIDEDTWEDKQSGQKRSKIKFTAETLALVGSKNAQEEAPRPAPAPRPVTTATKPGFNSRVDDTEETPF